MIARLVNIGAFGVVEPLFVAAEVEIRFGQRYALDAAQSRVNSHQQLEVVVHRRRERVDFARRTPFGLGRLFRNQLQRVFLHRRRSPGDGYGFGGATLDSLLRQILGGGEAPGAIGDHPDPGSHRFKAGGRGDLSVLRRQRPVALVHHPRLGVAGAPRLRRP